MAYTEHLALLKAGVEGWNEWREDRPYEEIDLIYADLSLAHLRRANLEEASLFKADLSQADLFRANLRKALLSQANLGQANLTEASLIEANLSEADLSGAKLIRTYFKGANLNAANLSEADLTRADFYEANLTGADLRKADLRQADLTRADLSEANLSEANLTGANLSEANLSGADLSEVDLSGADLINCNLVGTNIRNAIISNSNVYRINVWDLEGEFMEQKDLTITPKEQPSITVDNIKVAQFVYLLLKNEEIRDVINTLTSKTVLILGRFSISKRKAILDALRDKLREYDLLPIVFDFDRPADKDFTETIKTLAGISYFVIADVTNPKSSPLELQATVPDYQIPFVPIIQEGEQPFAMMVDLQKKYNWVLPTKSYDSIETLMSALKPGIIDPAVEMRNKLRLIKAQENPTESLKDYLDKSI